MITSRSSSLSFPLANLVTHLSSLMLLINLSFNEVVAPESLDHKVYIVYKGGHDKIKPSEDALSAAYLNMLKEVKGSMTSAMESMLYSYKHSFAGFAAMFSAEEVTTLSNIPGVLSVFESMPRVMHTTHSWKFLGLEGESGSLYSSNISFAKEALWKRANYGEDVVIGLLDTGIWPESESFNDEGMSPVPEWWKGVCEKGDAFNATTCNKKLIGARKYMKGYESVYGALNIRATGEFRSARDKDGHGTHTSSTAAGRRVEGASAIGGFGRGEASGGAPLARIAMYKVCWPIPGGSSESTCMDADMLAAIDDAVADGVHIISISIGALNPQPPLFQDAIAIGALHAVAHNILVSCSAGNAGPATASVANVAPWIVTVAASSIDRTFFAPVILGNGLTLKGETVTTVALQNKMYPLILGVNALSNNSLPSSNISAWQCLPGSLDPAKVKGKIVICFRGGGARVEKGGEVKRAGGEGVILANLPSDGNEISVDAYVLPGTAVGADATNTIVSYVTQTKNPVAKLPLATTIFDVEPSPFIAGFSSQGPSSLFPDILKPDISAPGLNILAAWTEANSPTGLPIDKRIVKYNIISGTSMSCPHISGSAALLKAIHPQWSPASIKSALMTTASTLNNQKKKITDASGRVANAFSFGSGEANPIAAADPGLVYDASYEDYVLFLCSAGYTLGSINKMTQKKFKCPSPSPRIADLNYPSVTLGNLNGSTILSRTLTNVCCRSNYTVNMDPPEGISVEIFPPYLSFQHLGEKKSFNIRLTVTNSSKGGYAFGWFSWEDEHNHQVKSPIAVRAI